MSGLATTRRLGWKPIVGILLVPLTIAGLFIWGLWSPTDRLRTVEAAVVNLDQPVEIDGQLTPLGRVFAGALIGDSNQSAEETNFTWQLTNEKDAKEGLDDGRYSTVVTIPENFSAAATSGADPDTAEQATIDIETSERGRLIDSALSNVVTSTATRVLNEQLGTAFVDQVFVGMGTLHTSLGDAASGADKLAGGSHQLADGATGLADGTAQLATGAGALAGGASELSSGLGDYAGGASALAGGARQVAGGTSTYVAGVNELLGGLQGAIGPITGAINGAIGGIESLTIDPVTGLPAGMADPTVNTSLLGTQLGELQGSLAAAGDTRTQLNGLVSECVASGASNDFCVRLSDSASANAAAIDSATTHAAAAAITQSQLAGESANTKAVLQTAFTDIFTAVPYLQGLSAKLGDLGAGITKLTSFGPQVVAGSNGVADGVAALAGGGQEIASGAGTLASGAQQLAAGTPALADGAAKLAEGAQQAATGTDSLAGGLEQAVDGVPNYTESQRDALAKAALTPVVATGSGDELFNAAGVPLFTGIALWAGGLAIFLILSPLWRRTRTAARGLGAITLRSALPGLVAGAAQGAIVGLAMPIALGLGTAETMAFLGFGLLAGVAFALMNQGLAALFGGFGRFISFVVLVVAFAGGIVSTAPAALRAVGDATPIGAAFSGFQAIASGATGAGSAAMSLVLWGLVGIALTGFAAARLRKADRAPLSDPSLAAPPTTREMLPA